jgi:hypothetical protein
MENISKQSVYVRSKFKLISPTLDISNVRIFFIFFKTVFDFFLAHQRPEIAHNHLECIQATNFMFLLTLIRGKVHVRFQIFPGKLHIA